MVNSKRSTSQKERGYFSTKNKSLLSSELIRVKFPREEITKLTFSTLALMKWFTQSWNDLDESGMVYSNVKWFSSAILKQKTGPLVFRPDRPTHPRLIDARLTESFFNCKLVKEAEIQQNLRFWNSESIVWNPECISMESRIHLFGIQDLFNGICDPSLQITRITK